MITHQLCKKTSLFRFFSIFFKMVQVVLKFQSECVIVTPHHFKNLRKQTHCYDLRCIYGRQLPPLLPTCSGVMEMISWAADHASIFGLKWEAMERTFTTFDTSRIALTE